MLGNPLVYRDGGLGFRMFFNEGNERPHVHVITGGGAAKFWLEPMDLCWNKGLSQSELKKARRQLQERQPFFMEQWSATQARKR